MIKLTESPPPNTAFLKDWLAAFAEGELRLAKDWETKTEAEKEDFAVQNGFRTHRSARECSARIHSVLVSFCQDSAFQTLWSKLAECDIQCDGHAMSPANGGFPARLLRTIEGWYQQPKLTQAELRTTLERMATLLGELSDLLGTISPDGRIDPFLRIRGLEDWQVAALYRGLGAAPPSMKPEANEAVHRTDSRNRVQYALKEAGITPAFVLQRLRDTTTAQQELHADSSSRKIRGKTAMKSHMVRAMLRLLSDSTMFVESPPTFEAHLVASLVAAVCDTDCSSDDVYKSELWKSLRVEDSRAGGRKSSTEKKK